MGIGILKIFFTVKSTQFNSYKQSLVGQQTTTAQLESFHYEFDLTKRF